MLLTAAGLTLAGEVTFSRDVAPILYKRCVNCHRPGDIAPMSLLTYKDARPWAASIKEAVLTRKMPPWKADPHYGKWSNDPSLTPEEMRTLVSWTEGSKAEGDPKDLPPAPVFVDGWKIGKPDVIFTIPEHTLEGKADSGKADSKDEHITVKVPTNFTEDMWITAAELRPGNRRIVHHAHVFVIDPEKKAANPPAAKDAAKDPAVEYGRSLQVRQGTEFWLRDDAPVINDGCAVDDNGLLPGHKPGELGTLISSYLPGRAPDVYPEGTARRVPAGSSLQFQIHYSRTTGKTETDATSIGLVFSKQPPRQVARRIDLSNHMFLIPPGDPNREVTECHSFRKDMFITSLTPHMHLRGKSMRMEVVYPDGRRETLLDVPAYNFNWQITYRAARPIFIPNGTRLVITAHFDNSANNPLNPDPAKVVRWGSESETEMMDGWVEYVDATPGADVVKSAAR
jgi:hypothetical protein